MTLRRANPAIWTRPLFDIDVVVSLGKDHGKGLPGLFCFHLLLDPLQMDHDEQSSDRRWALGNGEASSAPHEHGKMKRTYGTERFHKNRR